MRKWLKSLRESKGLSQSAISEKLSITQNYYCEIERGEKMKNLPLNFALKLCEIFDLNLDYVCRMELHENGPENV